MFRIVQVGKTEGLQSAQDLLNVLRKGGLLHGETADDIDNPVFSRWTDFPGFLRTVDKPK